MVGGGADRSRLFPAEVRGRALAVLFGGVSVATVVGVRLAPGSASISAVRWLFAVLAAAGAVALVALGATPPLDGSRLVDPTGPGSQPDRRRFSALIAMAALATTGAFAFFTYLSPYLTDVAEISAGLLSVVLLLRGLAGIGGVAVAGALVDALRGSRSGLRSPCKPRRCCRWSTHMARLPWWSSSR